RRAATPPLALEMELSAEAVPAAALAVSPEGGLAAVIGAVTDAAGASGGVVQAVVNTAPLRQGDRLPLAGTPGGGQLAPHALAYAPHGDAIYVLVQQRDDSAGGLPAVQRYAARGGAPLATRPIDGAFDPRALLLAADPACRFVYAAVRRAADDNERFPVEITRLPSDLGPGKQMQTLEVADDASSLRAFLVAPDGRRAYLAVGGRIAVVDLERWQALGAAWGPTAGAMSSGSSFSSAAGRLGGRLVGLALSPDGARLYAVQETMRPGNDRRLAREVVVIDAARLEQAAAGAASFAQAVLAVAPLNVTEGGSGERWLPAAATPDDARLLVAAETLRTRPGSEFAQETWDLYLVDTASHQVRETVGLPREPVAVAVTPDSRRALVLTVQDPPAFGPEVRAVELDGWSVDEWALTAGRAAPVCAPGAAKPSLRLGSPEGDTGLSQIVAVQGGQVYELRFQGRASGPEAAAEIFWLDGQCGRLGQATIPIDHRCAAGLWPHRLRAAAPAGADRAELRLRQPFGGFAIVDDVSLATPAAATANGDFAARTPATRPDNPDEPLLDAEGELVLVPAGWTLAPADLPASVLVQYQPDGTLRLTPPDARPATLSQELQVAPGRPVVLELEAHPYGPVGGEPATVELRWSGSTTAPLRVEVDPQQFDVVVVRGDAPADVTGAELAIVQPPGGALALRRIQVSQPASAEIPLTFLAEAPGDLAVADPVVVYDLGEAPQAPVDTPPGPSVPLGCAPTPPEDVPLPPGGPPKPGEDLLAEPDAGYCPCCERHHAPDDPAATTSESGMRGVAGRCPHGEARVVIYPARGHGGG
ncbi:MAG TPA: hypothetical protein VNL77_01255, partial [Roseiflexaceae bacterium]|nr:hypothetical protein [Roseiflexaceae bacterium]